MKTRVSTASYALTSASPLKIFPLIFFTDNAGTTVSNLRPFQAVTHHSAILLLPFLLVFRLIICAHAAVTSQRQNLLALVADVANMMMCWKCPDSVLPVLHADLKQHELIMTHYSGL